MTRRRFNDILAQRIGGTMVILDIAVPRDFDPRIHDGDRACLFNIDDLKRIREQTLQERQKHLPAAENIIAQELQVVHQQLAAPQPRPGHRPPDAIVRRQPAGDHGPAVAQR